MDTNFPRRQDDLSDVEQRLAGWRPAGERLDADAMLFAAGQAAARRGRRRILWPVVCLLLAGEGMALGLWGLSERAERQALAGSLRKQDTPPVQAPAKQAGPVAKPIYPPPPDGYLALRRQMEQDPYRWPAFSEPAGVRLSGPPPTPPVILNLGQRDRMFDQ